MSQPMRITIGSPATGDNFYPRDAVIQRLQKALETEHVLFLAPRRTGKTSVLWQLRQTTQTPCILLDLEEFKHPSQWIKAMAGELSKLQDSTWQRNVKQLIDFLPRIKSRYGHIEAAAWQDTADSLLDELHRQQQPVWFLLDEFPIMIDKIAGEHGTAMADNALAWIRRSRQQNANSPVRFLLTGSIGLDSVLRKHGIRGAANDLRRERLPELQAGEALELALKLAQDNGLSLPEPLAREYIQRLGPGVWPYFIQLFVAELQEATSSGQPTDLETLYRAVAHGKRNQYADNMWQRLDDVLAAELPSEARALLKLAATHDGGIAGDELRSRLPRLLPQDFEHLLEALQHDGYLDINQDGHVRFHSHLLRDYWRKKGRI